jgi:hypothetical protein
MQINYQSSFSTRVYTVQVQMIRNSANYQNSTVDTDYGSSLSHFDMQWDSAADGIVWLAIGR